MANVLGINLSELSPAAAVIRAASFLQSQGQHYIVTPNPEIILASHRDEELFYVLNKADLSIADGFGLKVAGLLAGKKIPRLTGADLTLELLSLAEKKGLRVAVLNWRGGLSRTEEIQSSLVKKYPRLESLVLKASRSQPLGRRVVAGINDFAPALLFCTFGSPYQEKAVYHNLKKLPSVRLAIGVGGTFDFITGRAIRAPHFLRHLGLEWLWRITSFSKRQLPLAKRWKRIYNATFVFIGKILMGRLNHFFYRSNVACWLYKKEAGKARVLIVKREDEPDHWQLPQGGTDGEKLAVAGAREMREELNTSAFKARAVFPDSYSYLFPPVSEQQSPSVSRRYKYDYKGQRQGLFVAEFTGTDDDIKVNFWDHSAWKWVDLEDLVASLHPVRQAAAKIFIEKFKSLNL